MAILTKEQAQEFISRKKRIVNILIGFETDDTPTAVILTTDHGYENDLTNQFDIWLAHVCYFPHAVARRTGLEDGIIRNIYEYIEVFLSDYMVIESYNELKQFLECNKTK